MLTSPAASDLRSPTATDRGSGDRPWTPNLRRTALAALVVVLVVEAAVRLVAPALRDPIVWDNPETNAKWHQIEDLASDGGVDAVFTGSSLVGVGLDPHQYADERDLSRGAYNAALLSSSIGQQAVWLQELVIPRLRPTTVVIGVSARELNANDGQLDRADIVFSEAPPVRRERGDETLLEQIERQAERASYVIRYREVLRRPATMFGDGPATPEAAMTDRGMSTALLDQEYTPFDPEIVARFGATSSFELDDGKLTQLRDLVRWLVDRGIAAVVVKMPMPIEGVDLLPNGAQDQVEIVRAVNAAVTAAGGQYVETGVWATDDFADQGHLNGRGAKRLTSWLAASIG